MTRHGLTGITVLLWLMITATVLYALFSAVSSGEYAWAAVRWVAATCCGFRTMIVMERYEILGLQKDDE